MSFGGLKLTGCVSGVAFSSCLHILMDLSASQVTRREPDWSKQEAKMPDSLSSEPGCTCGQGGGQEEGGLVRGLLGGRVAVS